MPRTKGPPTAAEFAVLGVLRDAPAHGYLVAQRFTAGQDLGLLYPLEQSAVYALLHELEARELIVGRREITGPRPPRTMFAITRAGEVHLQRWLAMPVEPLRRLRLDFLLKLHFAVLQGPASAAHLITDQLTLGEEYLATLDKELHLVDPDGLHCLVIESKRAAVQGFNIWLRSKRERMLVLLEGERTG